jgi:hypothetical protein
MSHAEAGGTGQGGRGKMPLGALAEASRWSLSNRKPRDDVVQTLMAP